MGDVGSIEELQALMQQAGQGPDIRQAMRRGMGQGATFGFADELSGAVDAAGAGLSGGDMGQAYTQGRDQSRSINDQAQQQFPKAYMGGQLAGAVPTAAVPVGGLLRGATVGSTIGRSAGLGATMGATQGAGEAPDMASVPAHAAEGAKWGGIVGAGVPAGVAGLGRLVSPFRTPSARQPAIEALQREGVDLTAGQATGSKPLQWMESTLGDLPGSGGRASEMMERQRQQLMAAALKRMGEDAPLATPDVMSGARDRIVSQFNDLASRNNLRYDQQFGQDIAKAVNSYDNVLSSQQKEIVQNYVNDIAQQPGGLTGKVYQETRSRLSRQANAIKDTDPPLSETLRGIRDALDSAMERSVAPADAGAWAQTRGQYGNMKTIERALSGAGENTAQGAVSPAQLRTAVSLQNRGAYVRGDGDLAELARSGEAVLKPLPQSGTAPRAFMQSLAGALGGAGGALVSGSPMVGGAAALAGLAVPSVLGRSLLSDWGQGYLKNQAAHGPGAERAKALAAALMAGPSRELAVDQSSARR